MDNTMIATDLAAQLRDAEAALELAIGMSAKLIEAVMLARPQLDLSAVADEGSVQKLTSSMAFLGQARTDLVSAHLRLDRVRAKAGVPTLGGGGFKPPPDAAEDIPFMAREGEEPTCKA